MRNAAVYEVTGTRNYRGHPPGEQFTARLPLLTERRAVDRGDIRVVRVVIPKLPPGGFRLPQGWAETPAPPQTEAPQGASSIGRE